MVKIVLGKKSSGPAGPGNGMGNDNLAGGMNFKEDFGTIGRRVKVMEERYTNLRSRFQVTEQNMLTKNKTFFTEIKTLNLELTEVKKEINELKDKILTLLKELDSFARKEDVSMLKKYIDFWNPINFVTKKDVEAIMMEILARKK